jgi:hypothetical protein
VVIFSSRSLLFGYLPDSRGQQQHRYIKLAAGRRTGRVLGVSGRSGMRDGSRRGRGLGAPVPRGAPPLDLHVSSQKKNQTVAVFLLQLVLAPSSGTWGLGFEDWFALRALVAAGRRRPAGAGGPRARPVQLVLPGAVRHRRLPAQHPPHDLFHPSGLPTCSSSGIFGPELENDLGRRGFLRPVPGRRHLRLACCSGAVAGDGPLGRGHRRIGRGYTVIDALRAQVAARQVLVCTSSSRCRSGPWRHQGGLGRGSFMHGSAGTVAVLVASRGAAFGLIWFKAAGALTQVVERRRREKAMRQFPGERAAIRSRDGRNPRQDPGTGSDPGRARALVPERRSRQLRERALASAGATAPPGRTAAASALRRAGGGIKRTLRVPAGRERNPRTAP